MVKKERVVTVENLRGGNGTKSTILWKLTN